MSCFGGNKTTLSSRNGNKSRSNTTKKTRRRTLQLPTLTGPFKQVGFLDIEFDDSIYARIYYPSVEAPSDMKRAPWIPSSPYYESYGNVIGLPWIISQALTRYLVSSSRIPSYEGLEPLKEQLLNFPLIIMSHGLGAFRTTYSAICTQLTSHGYLVAAIEHRDGSAGLTLTNKHTATIPYQRPKVPSPYDARQFSERKYAKAVGEHSWRHSQLLKRSEEVRKLLSILLQEQTCESWSPSGETHKDILKFILNAIDKQHVYLAGHSFGACTAMFTCSQDTRFQACIALDPWMFPIPDNDHWVDRPFPLIIINSYTFQWAENLHSIHSLIRQIERLRPNHKDIPVVQLTLIGSTHQEFGDFPCLISSRLIKHFRGHAGEIDPEMAIHVSVATALQFILQLEQKSVQEEQLYCKCQQSTDGICGRSDPWCRAKATASKVLDNTWSPTFHPIIDDVLSIDHISH